MSNSVLNQNGNHFFNNSADFGGVVCISGTNLISISSDIFILNQETMGGSFYFIDNSTVKMKDLQASNGHSVSEGGFIFGSQIEIEVLNSTFFNIYSGLRGGSIYCRQCNIYVLNSSYSSCLSVDGGCFYLTRGFLSVLNSNFFGSTTKNGGVFWGEKDRFNFL